MNDRYTEVLLQYELDVTNVRRGRGAWLCETSQGLKLLREYKGTIKRLEFEDHILSALKEAGGVSVDGYIRNKEGQILSVFDDGTKYIVKDWYADKECNLKDMGEITRSVEQIANLHKLFQRVEIKDEWNMGSILVQPPDVEMERHNQELKRARSFIRGKRKKSDFELKIMGNFNMFYEQALEAEIGMAQVLEQNGGLSRNLCHGDLSQHHILIGEGQISFIEFNRMHLGIQMTDLYHFMRKVMEKHDWDLQAGMSMIHTYETVLPLNETDWACLYYLFLYPEKYWKQINFYYNANKAWIPARNIEKLEGLQNQQENRNIFLKHIKNKGE